MVGFPPVFGKLSSKRCYLVPFFNLSSRSPVLISTGVCSFSPPVVAASRLVLGFFLGCFHARVGGNRDSRRADTGRESCGKRFSSLRDQYRVTIFSPFFAR